MIKTIEKNWQIILFVIGAGFFLSPLFYSAEGLDISDPLNFWVIRSGQGFLHVDIILGLSLIIMRSRFTFMHYFAFLGVGFTIQALGLIDEYLANGLRYLDIIGLNPQPVKIFIISLILIVAISLAFYKKSRNMKRIFASLILISMLGTTSLFHAVIVEGLFHARLDGDNYLRKAILEKDDKTFKQACIDIQAECLIWNDGDKISLEAIAGDASLSVRKIEKAKRPVLYQWLAGLGTPASTSTMIAYRGYKNQNRLLVDKTRSDKALADHRLAFYVLLNSAHLIWLTGGCFLLGWHERRIKIRNNILLRF